ncbi:MAG: patatin-like phospholipase family protein [Actinomycetota bacterium]|nr:patatin-like phospholipase family protein [Actinomycetota bacterium]
MSTSVPRIGLVLGAGGSVGLAYHGGVLAAIEEATGWDPRTAEVIVGTSAGSLTAAMLRRGLPAADLTAISEDRALSAEGAAIRERGALHNPRAGTRAVLGYRPFADLAAVRHGLLHPWSMSPASLIAALLPAGVVPTEALSVGLDAAYEGRWSDRPLWICSVRLRDGRRVVFGREGAPNATVGQAVAASCAIPSYFRPVRIAGDRYVDGGVRSMINLSLVADLGLDMVIVSSPMSWASRWPGVGVDVALRQLSRQQLSRELRMVRSRGSEVTAFQPTRRMTVAMGPNAMDARRRKLVSREAYRSTLAYLADAEQGRHLGEVLAQGGAGGGSPRLVTCS